MTISSVKYIDITRIVSVQRSSRACQKPNLREQKTKRGRIKSKSLDIVTKESKSQMECAD